MTRDIKGGNSREEASGAQGRKSSRGARRRGGRGRRGHSGYYYPNNQYSQRDGQEGKNDQYSQRDGQEGKNDQYSQRDGPKSLNDACGYQDRQKFSSFKNEWQNDGNNFGGNKRYARNDFNHIPSSERGFAKFRDTTIEKDRPNHQRHIFDSESPEGKINPSETYDNTSVQPPNEKVKYDDDNSLHLRNKKIEKAQLQEPVRNQQSLLSSDSRRESAMMPSSPRHTSTEYTKELARKNQTDTADMLRKIKTENVKNHKPTSSSSSSSSSSSEEDDKANSKSTKANKVPTGTAANEKSTETSKGTKSNDEADVVCLGKMKRKFSIEDDDEEETNSNTLPAASANSSNEAEKCMICDLMGHTSFQCQMICKNCAVPYHTLKTCPAPPNVTVMLQSFMEFCMQQITNFNPEKTFRIPTNRKVNNPVALSSSATASKQTKRKRSKEKNAKKKHISDSNSETSSESSSTSSESDEKSNSSDKVKILKHKLKTKRVKLSKAADSSFHSPFGAHLAPYTAIPGFAPNLTHPLLFNQMFQSAFSPHGALSFKH